MGVATLEQRQGTCQLGAVYSPAAQAGTVFASIALIFRLEKAAGETPIKKYSNVPMAILDYLVAKQQKSTCVDFSVLARGKIHRCFFLIQIATRKTNILTNQSN